MGNIDDLVAEYIRLHESIRTTDDLKVEQEFRESFRRIAALPPRDLVKAVQKLEGAGAMDLDTKVLLVTKAVEDIVWKGDEYRAIDEHFEPLLEQARLESGLGPDDHPVRADMPPRMRAVWDEYWDALEAVTVRELRRLGEDDLADLREHDPEGWAEMRRAILEEMRANRETVH